MTIDFLPFIYLCNVVSMRSGKYTLDDEALIALSRRQPLSFLDGHNFMSTNYEDAIEENNSDINLMRLNPVFRNKFRADTPDYILVFLDGSPMAWFTGYIDGRENNWVIPKLTMGLPHASLYRVTIFIDGLRLGRLSVKEF